MSTMIVGCGYLGTRIGRLLAQGGETVFGTVRSRDRAAKLVEASISPVISDVLDPVSIEDWPAADRLIYCIGFDRSAGPSMRSVYVDGLRAAMEGMDSRARRLVYVSATSVYGRNDGGWVDEESPADPVTESGRVCLDAERTAREIGDRRGIELVIVRYSGLYGPGRILREAALKRGDPIVGDPAKWLNLIQIDDAARVALAALEKGEPGQLYLASDDRPVPRREYYQEAAARLHAPAPRFLAPEPGSPESLRDDSNKRVSNRKIKSELGCSLQYPDIFTGLAASIANP